ncbi:hypothetical protein, partial [Sphingomonas carotinifaciens]|uniref:hypothetical protein n=1 Tax=Sphingomonas carotinifaciens TaxID=1166323 RepID=UPI001C84BE6B
SSSNSFVNRRCFVIEFAFHFKGTLHFAEASPECIVQRLGAELLRVCDRNRGSRLNFSGFYLDYARQLGLLIF